MKVDEVKGPWTVEFEREWGPASDVTFSELTDWTGYARNDVKFYSGAATYNTSFDFAPAQGSVYWIQLNQVKDVGIASVRLNNKDLGILWTKPFRIEITEALQAGQNELEIVVVNSWLNRLIGDRGKPQEERYTKTNIRVRDDWDLRESGLLGPLEILEIHKGEPGL
jgi:hypothetical protein